MRELFRSLPQASQRRIPALLLGGLAVFLHLGAVGHDFVYDDIPIIRDNPMVHSLDRIGLALTGTYWPGAYGMELGLWRPLTTAFYSVQWWLWDGNPVGFNAVLILLHGIATYLVVRLAWELASARVAILAGVVFAVHPVHVEAVANVVGTAEVLSAIFVLLAALAHVRGGASYGAGRIAAVSALYALAFLTKEASITFLGLVFLLDGLRENPRVGDLGAYVRRRWPLYLSLVVVAALVLLCRRMVLGSVASAVHPLGAQLLTEVPRIWTVVTTWPYYVQLMLFPLELSADYSPRVIPVQFQLTAGGMLGAGLVVLLLVLSGVLWRRAISHPAERGPLMALGFGVLWMVITLSPVSNLLFLSGILLAERTLYLPSAGFAIALSWMAVALAGHRRRLVGVAMLVWLGALGVRSVTRVPVWSSQVALFSDLVDQYPQSARAQWFVGDLLAEGGELAAARVHWKYAISLSNRDFPVVAVIAERMARYGDSRTARALLTRLEEDWPGQRAAMEFAAMTYANLRWQDDAIRAGRLALDQGAQKAVIYSLVANAYAQKGDFEEALRYRSDALAVAQRRELWALWYAMATDYEALGRGREALSALDSSRAHRPPPVMVPQLDSLETLLTSPSSGL